jgi:hypothetical protein
VKARPRRRIVVVPWILVVVVPLLVLVFDLRNKFSVQIILVDLSMVSVHLDRNRGKTTNWMRGRINGTKLPISILVDPIIRRPANLQTWAQKLEVFFRQFYVPQHPQYISQVMKTLSQRSTWTNKSAVIISDDRLCIHRR